MSIVKVDVKLLENVDDARERARSTLNPLRDTFLNRLAGIRIAAEDDETLSNEERQSIKSECASLRIALLDITKDPAFLAAETYDSMEASLMTRYRAIASGASTEVRNVFRELEA